MTSFHVLARLRQTDPSPNLDDKMKTEPNQQVQALLSTIQMHPSAQATGNHATNLGQAREHEVARG